MSSEFKMLFSPLQIRSVKLKNRIVKPGQAMGLASKEGGITPAGMGYYEALAKGSVGLLVVETTCVDFPIGTSGFPRQAIDHDKYLPDLTQLAKLIHSHDCPTFLQLSHAGPAQQQSLTGLQPVSASHLPKSQIPRPRYDEARELTIAEIEDVIAKFAVAAERTLKAGYDGVEIHGGHCYLINAFLSRAWNRRQDAYGGSLENRARFAVEVVRAIREKVGRDYPISIRLNGAEYGVEGGLTPQELQGIGLILQEAGVDVISITAQGYGSYDNLVWPEQMFYPEPLEVPLAKPVSEGTLVPLAESIKKAVRIPVVAVGRLTPALAENALRNGKADLVAFARRLIADPELPNKVAAGRSEDIMPCTACLTCWDKITLNQTVRCRINAALGQEQEYAIRPAGKKKRVVVVGGGPAGMEAARVAALRGHAVTLYEKAHKLGGLLPVAAVVKGTEIEDLPALERYFATQLNKLGVTIKLGEEVDPGLIGKLGPDAVVLATGGLPATLDIPGADSPIVASASQLHRRLKSVLRFSSPDFVRSLTQLWMPVGKRVIVIGGGIQGCELAEFLIKRGRTVTIVEMSNEIGADMVRIVLARFLRWLAKKDATVLTGVKCQEITDNGLAVISKEGQKKFIEADTIVPSLPMRPDGRFFEALQGKVPEVYLIGDASRPHLIIDAVADGSRIGRAI